MSALCSARREIVQRRRKEDRIASAAASCLLRYALHDTKNAVFCDAPIVWVGKPHFADSAIPIHFNLSHTVDKPSDVFAAAVLLSDTDAVGIDVEFVRSIRNCDALMRRLYTSEEQDYVIKSASEGAYFDIWCAKEAFVKLTGEGFSRKLSSVSVDVCAKTAASGEICCDLLWYTVGKTRICCAADDLSSGVEFLILNPEELITFILEEATWNEK